MDAAWRSAPERFRESLSRAAQNIRRFQEHVKSRAPAPLSNAEGGTVAVEYRPLARVGIYVPAGLASTLLMTAVPGAGRRSR